MLENDPLARLQMFPGPVSEQVIALTELWRERSKRTFVAMRERMNELEDLEVTPAAFDNYFRRSHREKTPELVVWALIRVMRDDTWLPKEQQCTLAEALYLAALKNVSVMTYARIYQLFPGQEEEFKQLCPLGDFIIEGIDSTMPGVSSHWARWAARVLFLALLTATVLWTFVSLLGWSPR